MSKPTLSIFTGTENFGNIFKEQNQINVKFTEFNFALTDVAGNTAVNWKGKTRFIMLQGAHDGSGYTNGPSPTAIKYFIDDMELWVRGSNEIGKIQAHITYTDSFGEAYNVYCVDWSWTRSFADPNRIIWSILMKQA